MHPREVYGKTPKLAKTPYTELIYIERGQKSRNRGQGGTRGATASGVGATAGRRTARGEGGGEKTGARGEGRWEPPKPFSQCGPRPLGPAAWKLHGANHERRNLLEKI